MTRNPAPGARGATLRFATVGFVAAGALVLPSGTALAEPSEEEATERYEQLQEELSELNEAYNQADEDHEAAQAELEEVEEQISEADEEVDSMSGEVAAITRSAYSGESHSLVGVLFDTSPDAALQNIADMDYLSLGQQNVLSDYTEELERSERLHEQALATEEAAAESLEEAETAREEGEAALEEQAELLEGMDGVDPNATEPVDDTGGADAEVSGDAQAVLDFARDQIGKPYVWGGTGPDGFDCSGLTQAAWAEAGVSLPRTTFEQVNAGTPVSRDEVEPGDLLFFYDESSPSHVGIYSGDGQMIHGSNPSKPLEEVALADFWDSVFTGAVRPQ